MSDAIDVRMFRVNDTVHTPNGIGIVQGRLWSQEDGTIKILVSHNPKSPDLGPELREKMGDKGAQHSLWVLHAYEPSQVTK